MMTFFTILFVLIVLNVAMVVASLQSVNKKSKRPTRSISGETKTVIYPIDLIAQSYKKAV